jgi:hypothetical protein
MRDEAKPGGVTGDSRRAGPQAMRKRHFTGLALVLLAGTVPATMAQGSAAAAPQATVTNPPTEVAVDFDNPLDPQFVKLEVIDEKGGSRN